MADEGHVRGAWWWWAARAGLGWRCLEMPGKNGWLPAERRIFSAWCVKVTLLLSPVDI